MGQALGELVEIYLENGQTGGRLLCPPGSIPSAGQYLLAHDPASSAPLPVSLFCAVTIPGGFLTAPPLPLTWRPGHVLSLRGPLGRGFSLPTSARNVALAALGETTARMRPLLSAALEQTASVVLVSDLELPDLPPEVEIQLTTSLAEVVKWADYLALDLPRASLPGLREKLGFTEQDRVRLEAQALVLTPMPCGGMAECGVCAVSARRGWRLACKDGPVFDLKELL
jgi:hypothetical protein